MAPIESHHIHCIYISPNLSPLNNHTLSLPFSLSHPASPSALPPFQDAALPNDCPFPTWHHLTLLFTPSATESPMSHLNNWEYWDTATVTLLVCGLRLVNESSRVSSGGGPTRPGGLWVEFLDWITHLWVAWDWVRLWVSVSNRGSGILADFTR